MRRIAITAFAAACVGLSLGAAVAQEERPNRPRRPDDNSGAEQGPRREVQEGGQVRPGPGGFGQAGFGQRGGGGPGGPGGGFGGPPGGFGGPPGCFGGALRMPAFMRPLPETDLVNLVALPEVQKDLRLSGDQQQQSQAIVDRLQGDLRSAMDGFDVRELFELEPEERDKKFAALRGRQEQAGQAAFKELNKVLDAQQWSRLSELDLQRAGTGALRRPPVAERLNLTQEQRERLDEILDQAPPFLPPEARREIDG